MRLSGKLNNNFRIGLLNMQTQEDIENEIAATNNSIIALQHKLFNRSNISFIFINKQATKNYDFSETGKDYNRLIGLDYNLASKDNKWNGKYYIHKHVGHEVEKATENISNIEGNFVTQSHNQMNQSMQFIANSPLVAIKSESKCDRSRKIPTH